MMYVRVLLAALAVSTASAFGAWGHAATAAITNRTHANASVTLAADLQPTEFVSQPPTLTSSAQALSGSMVRKAARLAQQVSDGTLTLARAEKKLRDISYFTRAPKFGQVAERAGQLPDKAWRHRLVPGIDPSSRLDDLPYVAIDLEGSFRSPTEIGLVQVDNGVVGVETTLHITPANGSPTNKSIERRLLNPESTLPSDPSFPTVVPLFNMLTEGRVPVGFNTYGDIKGLAAEFAHLDAAQANKVYGPSSRVEWIDTEVWARMFAPGRGRSLGDFHERVLERPLLNQHAAVPDARAAIDVMDALRRDHKGIPTTYGALIRHQVAFRQLEGQLQRTFLAELTEAFETELARLESRPIGRQLASN